MGILDDAIREHLDLKRKHGAREAELREIEDEALGAGDQPDPFSAGGDLMGEASSAGSAGALGTTATEEPPAGLGEPPAGGEEPTRLVEPESLRSEPEAGSEADEPETSEPDLAAPSESLEELIAEEEPFPEDAEAPPPIETSLPETPLPDDAGGPPEVSPEQESLDVPALDPDEAQERPLEPSDSVPDPPPPPPDAGPEPPGRARGRVDVPTQEHPPPGQTGDLPPFPDDSGFEPETALPPAEDEPFADGEPADSGSPALYDFETDEEDSAPASPPETEDDFEALGPAEEEAPYLEEEEPYAEEPGTEVRPALDDEELDDLPAAEPRDSGGDDEDDLWFEKGPPKDFDFDD